MSHAHPNFHAVQSAASSPSRPKGHNGVFPRRSFGSARDAALCVLLGAALLLGCGSDSASKPEPDAAVDDRDAAIDQSLLGIACRRDRDCGDQGLYCAASMDDAIYGGHVVNGLCTAVCDGVNDPVCLAFGGLCENVSDDPETAVFRCLQTCTPGSAAKEDSKCRGRAELACAALDIDVGVGIDRLGLCYPVCDAASKCGSERQCHVGFGVCRSAGGQGDAFGAPCSPDDDTCAGQCIGYADAEAAFTYGYCSQPCTYGAETACTLADGVQGACRFGGPDSAAPGDYAYCQPACEKDADCEVLPASADLHCDLSTRTVLGHGLCEWGLDPVFPDAGMPMDEDAGVGDGGR